MVVMNPRRYQKGRDRKFRRVAVVQAHHHNKNKSTLNWLSDRLSIVPTHKHKVAMLHQYSHKDMDCLPQ
jgi:hypothetical protein